MSPARRYARKNSSIHFFLKKACILSFVRYISEWNTTIGAAMTHLQHSFCSIPARKRVRCSVPFSSLFDSPHFELGDSVKQASKQASKPLFFNKGSLQPDELFPVSFSPHSRTRSASASIPVRRRFVIFRLARNRLFPFRNHTIKQLEKT